MDKNYEVGYYSFSWQSGTESNNENISENENSTTYTYPSNDEIISTIMEKYKNREDTLNEMKKHFVFDNYCAELLDEYIKNKRDGKIDDIIK